MFALALADESSLVIKGSNTFGQDLAPALIREFRRAHPEIVVKLESKGSGSGFAALLAGRCDIASSSRPATEDERRLARSRGIELTSYPIGYYGVAVIVNAGNPVERLSDVQVREIFTGAIADWRELGESPGPVHIYVVDPSLGESLGFQELAMERRPYAASAKMCSRDEDAVVAVSRDPGGIGYADMALGGRAGVRMVRINGIPPTVLTVNSDDYPYSRTLRLYIIRDRESPAARQFIGFVRSKAGQDLLGKMGFVRLNEPRLLFPDW
jgi:phosphate transport system substrate-binding protein